MQTSSGVVVVVRAAIVGLLCAGISPAVGVGAVGVGAVVGPLSPGSAESAVQPPPDAVELAAAPQLAAQTGISLAQAQADIQVQSQATQANGAPRGIVEELQAQLGSGYAGVWFDLHHAQFEVGVAPSTDATAADAALSAEGVLANSQLVPVRSTWGQLVAAQASVTAADTALITQGDAQVGIDPANNAVEVALSDAVSASTLSQVASQATPGSVALEVKQLPVPSLDGSPTTCLFPFCGRPLRGGVQIEDGYCSSAGCNVCTSGFVAFTSNPNVVYLMTAGHCLSPIDGGGGSGPGWYTYNSSFQKEWIGPAASYIFGNGASDDAGLIQITGKYWQNYGYEPTEVMV